MSSLKQRVSRTLHGYQASAKLGGEGISVTHTSISVAGLVEMIFIGDTRYLAGVPVPGLAIALVGIDGSENTTD